MARPRQDWPRRGWLTGSRRPGCRPVLEGSRPAPAGHPPALAANPPAFTATGQHSRQPASRRSHWGCLSGLGPEFVIFIIFACAQAGLGLTTYHGREAADRAVPEIALSHYQHWAVNLMADRAGLQTQESRRRGRPRAGPRLEREPLFAGNPRCTIAIRPWRQTGGRRHSGPITAVHNERCLSHGQHSRSS
jgi:hypothetical protein